MSSPTSSADVARVSDGIVRATFALPLGIDHVHCYLLETGAGTWTIVDSGLGVADAEERWGRVLRTVGGRASRIVITHFHPDHVGAAAVLSRITGAPVHQGTLDYAQCVRAWGPDRSPERLLEYMRGHGMPESQAADLLRESRALGGWVSYAPDPQPLEPGDVVDGWEVVHLPGHADGHLSLLRDGVLIAGDALLATISPNVGLYPDSRPDPLADYLSSLGKIVELAPRVAFAGHGATITEPARRAQELVEHHEARLSAASAELGAQPRTSYDVSLALFPEPLSSGLRRFALAETRAHLEHLVHKGRARRVESEGPTRYAVAAT